jgi:sugar phosphate isomerase/epimerase
MKVSLAIQSLRSCTLEEAAGITRALGFDALELDGVMDKTISREGILTGSKTEVERVRALGLKHPSIHWTFGTASFYPVLNDPDPAVREANREQIKRLAEFCHASGIDAMLVLPGMVLPGQSEQDLWKCALDAFREFHEIGKQAGVGLMFESHVGSAFETPTATKRIAQEVPGVGIALDYTHFVCQGYTVTDIEPLIPYSTHVHMRQAKPGLLQTKLEDGTIHFPMMLEKLRQSGFDGYLSVEYVHQNYIGADNVDVLTESVKMRDLIRRFAG